MTMKINVTGFCYRKRQIYFHLLVKLGIKFIHTRTFLENNFDFSEIITSSRKWGQSLRIIGNNTSLLLFMPANVVYDLSYVRKKGKFN